MLFYIVGGLVCGNSDFSDAKEKEERSDDFYSLLAGILLVVTVYAIAISKFKTVFIFIAIAGAVCLKRKRTFVFRTFFHGLRKFNILQLIVLLAVFTIVFNYLPESEYKQKDSFYYLKISESLNLTGQENTNNYYNILSSEYRGVEMYHYFECWLSALLINGTHSLLPNMLVFRIVAYSVISIVFLYGLFYAYKIITGRDVDLKGKLICISFLFFKPDLYDYLPSALSHYLVFNFENNFLERPNFRLIYLFLLPVLLTIRANGPDKRFIFFLICLCLINPTIFLAVIAAFLLLILAQITKLTAFQMTFISRGQIFIFLSFIALYALFYCILSAKGVPAMYDFSWDSLVSYYARSYRFVALTIVASLIYIAGLVGGIYFIFRMLDLKAFSAFVRDNKDMLYLSAALILGGIVVGRAAGFIENLYQVAFNSYIVASIAVFMALIAAAGNSRRRSIAVVALFASGYFLYKVANKESHRDIFSQNGAYDYAGRKYSDDYLKQIEGFAKTRKAILGAYIADSAYYRDLHYGSRNPNVYHLPATYIMAGHSTVNDICLSDPDAIKYDGFGRLNSNEYLNNAIERSCFHREYGDHIISDSSFLKHLREFIKRNRLEYLILTPGVNIQSVPGITVGRAFTDANTRERFWVFTR